MMLGWLGAAMLSACGIPQAWSCFRSGQAKGISAGFVLMWGGGEIVTFLYLLTFPKLSSCETLAWPLVVNYLVNILSVSVIVRYRFWPRGGA
jgi:uncharacterized protein with PQ loop repeat